MVPYMYLQSPIFLCHTRNARAYYGLNSNSSLLGIYNGASINISMDEIYNINYNKSIPQIGKLDNPSNPSVIEVTIDYIYGLDGNRREAGTRLLKLPMLNSNAEVCFSFDFLKTKGAKLYKFNLKMFADSTPSKGSCPCLIRPEALIVSSCSNCSHCLRIRLLLLYTLYIP